MSAADIVLEGHFTADDRGRYHHLPFTMPAGVEQIEVRYDYSDRIASDPTLTGGNTLDLGLFDERGTEAGGPGFRGWSGSNKRELVLGAGWATPPYRPGPISAGTWTVLLGPYKVGPRGLDYRVEITLNPGRSDAPLPPSIALPERPALRPARPGWARADLHAHTVFSDGDAWPDELAALATARGLDVLGITDHNGAVAPQIGLAGGPVLVPGVEVTTYGGHWNAWGGAGWYEFREPTPEATRRAMQRARDDGAFVSVNHPRPYGPEWTYGVKLPFDAVEVWNGHWAFLNEAALAWWDALLKGGRRPVAIGGSDTHYLHRPDTGLLPIAQLGTPTTWIQLPEGQPRTADAVLTALRAGRCFVSTSPAGPQLYLDQDPEGRGVIIEAIDAEGSIVSLHDDEGCRFTAGVRSERWTERILFAPRAAYLRAQLLDPFGTVLAVTNPVWRDGVT